MSRDDAVEEEREVEVERLGSLLAHVGVVVALDQVDDQRADEVEAHQQADQGGEMGSRWPSCASPRSWPSRPPWPIPRRRRRWCARSSGCRPTSAGHLPAGRSASRAGRRTPRRRRLAGGWGSAGCCSGSGIALIVTRGARATCRRFSSRRSLGFAPPAGAPRPRCWPGTDPSAVSGWSPAARRSWRGRGRSARGGSGPRRSARRFAGGRALPRLAIVRTARSAPAAVGLLAHLRASMWASRLRSATVSTALRRLRLSSSDTRWASASGWEGWDIYDLPD